MHCPVEFAPSTDANEAFNTGGWMEEHSQAILDDPDSLPDVMAETESILQDEHAAMAEHDPLRADIAIARRYRAVFRAPAGALYNAGGVAVLQSRPVEQRADFIRRMTSIDGDYSTEYVNAIFHGQAHRWMHAVANGVLGEAVYPLWDRNSSSGKVYAALEEFERKVYDKMADAYEAAGQTGKAYHWRRHTLIIDAHNAGSDNVTAVLDCMRAGQLAMVLATGRRCEADEAAGMLFDNIDVMSRLASINRETIAKVLPPVLGHDPAWHVGQADGSDLPPLENVFSYDAGRLVPRHPSLRHGPWPVPRNCSGIYRLRLPDQETTDANGRFFEEAGHPEYGPDSDGAIRAVDCLFGIGIEVGRHTILQPARSPLLRRYVTLAG